MRTTLYCLIIALILRGAFDYVTAQTGSELKFKIAPSKAQIIATWDNGTTPDEVRFNMPSTYTFSDVLHGSWLTVGRVNYKDDPNGFDPCWTYIKVNAKPIVRRIAKDKYEITFTSELAEGLP